LSVDGVGLRQLPYGAGEVADLPRIDHAHRNPVLVERQAQRSLVAARGLQAHEDRPERLEVTERLLQSHGV
jgi:hypothetical protein